MKMRPRHVYGPCSILPFLARYLRALVTPFVLSAILLAVSSSSGAEQHLSVLDTVKELTLPTQPGKVTAYYSACCRQRALDVQSALADCLQFFKQHLGIQEELVAAVLDKDDWNRDAALQPEFAFPYGMTHVPFNRPYVAFIPADDAGVITQGLLAEQAHVTAETRTLLSSTHLNFSEAARKFIMHPALHEVGHTLEAEYGIQVMRSGDSAWLNELVASYFAYAFEKSKRPETATIMEAVTKMSVGGPLKYTRLEDFTKTFALMASGDSSNFFWYQHQFEGQVVRVFANQGLDFLVKLKAEFPAGSKTEPLPGELISQLEKISPGFQAWQLELQSSH
jgi:hypothetical protein